MTAPLTLVVAGVPALARALEGSGQFSRVFAVESTAGMRDLIKQGLLQGSTNELAFIFADTLHVDTPQTPLGVLIQKLTSAGYKVIVAELSPAAADLVTKHPGAGLLPGPFSVNLAIGAIRGLGFTGLEPVAGGGDVLDITAFAAPAVVAAPAAPAAASDWGAQAPAWDQPAPAAPAWEEAAPTAPAAPAWDQPAPAAPAPGSWDTPAPAAPAAPAWDQPAPAAAPASPSGWGSPAPAPGAWEAPPAAGGWDTPTSEPAANPWDNSAAGPQARANTSGPRPVVQRRGYVVTVAAPKGGTGKSTLTLNLACYMGLRLRGTGKTVCVIDTNFQQADTGKYLNQYSPNVIDIVKDPGSISVERLNSYLVHKQDYNFSCLLGPARVLDANPVYINPYLYGQLLEVLRQLYDYIFIDTPVAELYHDTFSEFALPQANFIVVPIAPSLPTLANADNWLRSITAPRHTGGTGIEREKIGIVLNRAQEGIDCSVETVRENLASWKFVGMIPETTEWQRANNNFELVATKNFHELNEAFAHILYAATGEEILRMNVPVARQQSASAIGGLLKKLRGGKG